MKKVFTMAITLAMAATTQFTCLSAGWQKNATGYWYENTNGTWPANTWQWIDGNQDGKAECYYFDQDGYMLSNTITPDGYMVNSDGAWIENGIIQVQTVPILTSDTSNNIITSDTFNNMTISNNPTDNLTEAQQSTKKIYELVNQARITNEKLPLEWNDTLSACAEQRAKELAEAFSHSRPNKTSCFTIYREYGVNYNAAGENIAMGQPLPEQIMDSWMNSSGHKANILDSNFGKIGIGYYYENGQSYWVQMFSD